MLPYSLRPDGNNDVGCCPGHDWPVCYRFCGKYAGRRPQKKARLANKRAKRIRRRVDKAMLRKDMNDE